MNAQIIFFMLIDADKICTTAANLIAQVAFRGDDMIKMAAYGTGPSKA